MTRKMSPSEILNHLLKGQGLSLDREAVMEVINSLGEVGFSAPRIARIIKGEAAELAGFRRQLEKLAETNDELRKLAELQVARITDFEGRKSRPAPPAEKDKDQAAARRRTSRALGTDQSNARREESRPTVLEIMVQDPMEALLRGPRPQ